MLFKGYRIESTRLPWWDYGWAAEYFITICTKDRKRYFGQIQDDRMIKTELWYIAKKYWQEIPEHFPFVTVLDFIIMPDHIHGLLRIEDRRPQQPVEMSHGAAGCVETHHDASQRPHNTFGPQKNNIPSIIRHFKGAVTRYSKKRALPFEWQSLYYDQIIRDDNHFYNVQDYIRSNIRKYQDKRLT